MVVGTKTATDINELLLGTSTDKLLRRINCPVLSVNQVVSEDVFKHIVFPTTTRSSESHLIDVLKGFQQVFGSKLHLLRVNTRLHFMSDKDSLKLLEEYADDTQLTNFQCHVYSNTEEEDGILEFARSLGVEGMIAVSTSAHTGLRKVFQGSITKELIGHAKRPVLTMKMD